MKLLRTLAYAFFALTLILWAFFYLPLFWFFDLIGRAETKEKLAWRFARRWGRLMILGSGSRVEMIGKENLPPGPVVVMGNHQSAFDIMLMLGYIEKPLAFIAKQETARYPIVSSWMRHLGCLFLDRQDARQAVKVIAQGVELLKNGASMVIFPEGTRSRGDSLLPFKKGSLKLALRSQVPIVPVSISGTYMIFEANNKRVTPAKVRLVIHPPVPTDGSAGDDSASLSEEVRQHIIRGIVSYDQL